MEVRIHELTEKINVVAAEVTTLAGSVNRDGNVSDDKVFMPGAVRYIDPKHLRPFTTARQAAWRACRARGVRFRDGFGIGDEALPGLLRELEKIGNDLNAAKERVVRQWPELLLQWEQQHPEIKPFSSKFPPQHYAEKHIGFAVSVMKIQPAEFKLTNVTDGIQCEIQGLAARVLDEIAQDVKETWCPKPVRGSIAAPREKATQKIINGLLLRVVEKARSLSFIGGGRLAELATFIETTINKLPREGVIEGNNFLVLSGLMSILESPYRMANGELSVILEPALDRPMINGSPHSVASTMQSKVLSQGNAQDHPIACQETIPQEAAYAW